jgi:hypothetical protein
VFERLPDWVNTAGEWIAAVIMGMGGLAIMALVGGMLAYGIRLIMGKDDEQ